MLPCLLLEKETRVTVASQGSKTNWTQYSFCCFNLSVLFVYSSSGCCDVTSCSWWLETVLLFVLKKDSVSLSLSTALSFLVSSEGFGETRRTPLFYLSLNSPWSRALRRTAFLSRRSFYRNVSFSARRSRICPAGGPPCWNTRLRSGARSTVGNSPFRFRVQS